MTRLALGALLLGSLAMTSGCIITTSDDDVTGGSFTIDWILTSGEVTITCADAGANIVRTRAVLTDTDQEFIDVFDCTAGSAMTPPLPLGDYNIIVEIADEAATGACSVAASSDCNVLATSVPRTASLLVDGDVVDVGSFDFSFAAAGNIDFSVAYGDGSGTNCDDVPTGAGVVAERLELTLTGGGSCIRVELLVGDASEVGDICAADASCVAKDEIQTLVNVPPGDYDLTINGVDRSSIVCFAATHTFTVDGDDDLGTLTVPLDTDVCTS